MFIMKRHLSVSPQSGGQLVAVGERCLGEHHSQVLARQKETVAHLRQQLKEREDGQPTG